MHIEPSVTVSRTIAISFARIHQNVITSGFWTPFDHFLLFLYLISFPSANIDAELLHKPVPSCFFAFLKGGGFGVVE